jgi:hypothetical protein
MRAFDLAAPRTVEAAVAESGTFLAGAAPLWST